MRLLEFAQKFNVTPDDIITILQEKGVKAQSAMFLSDALMDHLKEKLHIKLGEPLLERKIAQDVKAVLEQLTVGDLADRLKCQASDVIIYLLKKGIVANKNKMLTVDQVRNVIEGLGGIIVAAELQSTERVGLHKGANEAQEHRLPIVVVMGHVDHGKTTLLDYVRKTSVAAKEKGGITQHLGAYEVATSHGNIVFLDTPGHEAFSLIRERGALIADILILVIAADDGIMPQTKECILLAQSLQTPIVVALNKVDKATPHQIENTKRQLSGMNVLAEEWGGQTPCLPISAKTGMGVDHLLEIVALQAEMMDLKTSSTEPAQGYVLESKVEKGRGFVATVILTKGTLRVGDWFTTNAVRGRVSSMVNDRSKNLQHVGPSVPVLVAGFEALPVTGEVFKVVTLHEYKRWEAEFKEAILYKNMVDSKADAINVLLKAGSLSSLEALLGQMKKINIPRAKVLRIVDVGVGNITENNITFAQETGAIIFGLDVKVERQASAVLKNLTTVEVKLFDIIYKLVDEIEAAILATQVPDYVITPIGKGFVKAVFTVKSVGIIAGVQVEKGNMKLGEHVFVTRKGKQIAEGTLKTLQQERANVTNVPYGHDCALSVVGFSSWREGDIIECVSKKIRS